MEEVVLVDEQNNVLGTTPKKSVHGKETPLHRAFSLFIFNESGQLLLQQRSGKKKTWPLMWSNSCCGHPALNETNENAAIRRSIDELGLDVFGVEEVSPYRYMFVKDGVMENEICPILVGFTVGEPKINSSEVEDIQWIGFDDFLIETRENPEKYSPWCVEEVDILSKKKKFLKLMKKYEK